MYKIDKLNELAKVVAEKRAENAALEPRRMTAEEKDDLLAHFHPDYKQEEFTVLSAGVNKGDKEIESYIQGIDYISEVVVLGDKNELGEEGSLVAEVYLNEIKTSSEVMKGIRNACKQLPLYKQISRVVIRDEEFEKTSSNKIKRSSAQSTNSKKNRKNDRKQNKKD